MQKANLLQKMKQQNFELAEQWAIPVNDEVWLVPIGTWMLSHNQYVEEMATWRFASRNSFFARFPFSYESFNAYLVSHAINDQSNLTFAIMRNKSELLGHLGLSSVVSDEATIDAVMIRPSTRSSGLARMALQTLINWSAQTLSVRHFTLEVLSSNEGAIRLYSRLGFEISSRYHLRQVGKGEVTTMEECTLEESNVEELKFVMSLKLIDSPVT